MIIRKRTNDLSCLFVQSRKYRCYDIFAKCLIHTQNLNNFKYSMQSGAKIPIFQSSRPLSRNVNLTCLYRNSFRIA